MILLKNDNEFELMKKAGSILAMTMKYIAQWIMPGTLLDLIDKKAHEFLVEHDTHPSFLGLYGYPYSLCASINNEVIHGFPSKSKRLNEGDIVSIDIGCCYQGYHADMAYTFPVGQITAERKKLLDVTQNSLDKAIDTACPGATLGDIGYIIQHTVETSNYSVVRDYTGHGIGMHVHEEPQIPNFGHKGKGMELKKGMALAIEPMVNAGSHLVRTLDDKWTVVTQDGCDSAHFEHTVFIRDSGPEVLTRM